jgi:hypothetical protein
VADPPSKYEHDKLPFDILAGSQSSASKISGVTVGDCAFGDRRCRISIA